MNFKLLNDDLILRQKFYIHEDDYSTFNNEKQTNEINSQQTMYSMF